MPYKIVVTKTEPNTNFDAEVKAWKVNEDLNRNCFRTPIEMQEPSPERETKQLETILTDAEFDTVRKACLGQI